MQTVYHITVDLPGAIAKAVDAGVDMSMPVFGADQWQTAAFQAVQSGATSQDRIDGQCSHPDPQIQPRPCRPTVHHELQRPVRRLPRGERVGYGLCTAPSKHTALTVTPTVSATGSATVRFTATNAGSQGGTDIVPGCVDRPVSDMVTPPQRLVGFRPRDGEGRSIQDGERPLPGLGLGETQGDIGASGPPTVQPGAHVVQMDKAPPSRTTRTCPRRAPCNETSAHGRL